MAIWTHEIDGSSAADGDGLFIFPVASNSIKTEEERLS